MGRQFASAGWTAQLGTIPYPAIGVCLGSAYQEYFNGMAAAQQQAEVAAMREAGIAWVRIDVNWTIAQPSAGKSPDFTFAGATARALVAGGMHVVAILLSNATQVDPVSGKTGPFWPLAVGNNGDLTTAKYPSAAPVDSGGTNICPFPTVDPSVYASFCAAAVTALSKLGVEAFELCNEPNLDFPGAHASFPGLGFLEPVGYASLATAAYRAMTGAGVYQPGVAGQRPTPIVLGGALAGYARLDYVSNANLRAGAGWNAVAGGSSTTATISCATAQLTDRYALICGSQVSTVASTDPTAFGGLWPPGTYISAVTTDAAGTPTGYEVSPPPGLDFFPDIAGSGSAATFGIARGFPPDVYLVQAYQAAAGAPMFDALTLHPYSWPGLPANAWLDAGSWGIVPGLREIMKANGEGAKQIWFTEIGAPTGQCVATWPAAAATDTQLVVSSPDASAEHVGWLVDAPGVPLNSYVASVRAGSSWTVVPPTGLVLTGRDATTAIGASGGATTTLGVASTLSSGTVTIAQGTALTVWYGGYNASGAMNGWALSPVSATVAAAASVPPAASGGTGTPVTIQVDSATLPSTGSNSYLATAGGVVQGSVSPAPQWGTAIAGNASGTAVNLVAPGCVPQWSDTGGTTTYSSESQQAAIIGQSFALSVVTPQYLGPVFVYCWSDIGDGWNAGPFGLNRVDGTAKPALAVLAGIARAAGRLG